MSTPMFSLARPLSVLVRPDDSLQLGLDAEGGLVFPDVPPGADAAVRALRQPRTLLEVSRLVPALPRGWLDGLVETLLDAGALRRVEPAAAPAVLVLGGGPLSDQAARLLAAEGWAVRDGVSGAVGGDVPVLVCAATAEPDRVLTRDLTASGQAHLVVRAEPERAVVGPFVVPGRAACVGCTDLVRRDLDAGFPHLLAQLCRSEHTPAPRQAAWAAAVASAQLEAWRAGRTPEALGATLELDAHTGGYGVRAWPRHPDCGCAMAWG